MNISIKTTIKVAILLVFAVAFGLVATSCGDLEEPTEPEPASNVPATDSYLDIESVSALHIIGSSPCPQKVTDVKIFCGKADSCTADSAVITNPNTGLNISFENGKSSIALDSKPLEYKTISVDFNCQVPESFTHIYTIILYKNGVKVGEQDLEINMKVE